MLIFSRPLPCLFRFGLTFFLSALCAQAIPKSPWTGVWSGKLGDLGVVALRVDEKPTGEIISAQVLWLVDVVPVAFPPRLEGDTLFVPRLDHKDRSVPALAFRMIAPDQIKLTPYGVLSAPLDPLFENLTLTKSTASWYDLTTRDNQTSEVGKWHDQPSNRREPRGRGRDSGPRMIATLKPLPAAWPAVIVVPTATLLSRNGGDFLATLAQTTLTAEFIREVWAWTEEKSLWENQKEAIIDTLVHKPNVPVDILEKAWAQPGNSAWWIAAAASPQARPEWPDALLNRIMQGNRQTLARAIASGDGPAVLYLRIAEADPGSRGLLASSRKMPAAVYEQLARSGDPYLRMELATNEAAPLALLEQFATSDDRNLKFALLRNRGLPADLRKRVVRELALSAKPKEKDLLASDPDLPPELIPVYANELHPAVRAGIARNPQTGTELLVRLANEAHTGVADIARYALRSRFPADYPQLASSLKPLGPILPLSLNLELVDAIQRGNVETFKSLADCLQERGELGETFGPAIPVLLKSYQPAIMDYYLTNGYARDRGILADLAGTYTGDIRWLTYFKAHGVFENDLGRRALMQAVKGGWIDNFAALLALGIDVNAPSPYERSLLHEATATGQVDIIALLLKAGARQDVVSNGQTPLELAVKIKFMPSIRMLDVDGKYAAMTEPFTKEFPPAPASRFLGEWNASEDSNINGISLLPDGTGHLGSYGLRAVIAWRETGPNEAVAYSFGLNSDVDRQTEFKMHLDPEGTKLSFEGATVNPVPMRRDTKRAARLY